MKVNLKNNLPKTLREFEILAKKKANKGTFNWLNAAAENGFGDIEVGVFEASGAGDRAGMVIASVQAPNLSRLGAFMDQRWSSWMSEASQEFPTLRTPEHEWVQTCTTLYSSN